MARSVSLTVHDGGARPLPSNWRRLLDALPPEVREAYEERAALIEYDGGEKRRTAERRAFECVVWRSGLGQRRFPQSQDLAPMLSRRARFANRRFF
jgi:hypothetical protein